MTGQEPTPDVLKAITDKLAELEDLQLVNKLDIINVKNELDKASLSGGGASTEDMDKLSELRHLVEKSDRLKKAERMTSELDEMKAQFEKIKKTDSASLRHDFDTLSKEFEGIKARMSAPAKKGAFQRGPELARPDLEELRQRIGKLESVHPSEIDLELPEEIRGELSKINEKISSLEKSRSPSAVAGKMDNVEALSGKVEALLKSLDVQRERISGIETSLIPAGGGGKKAAKGPKGAKETKEEGGGVQAFIVKRLDMVEKRISDLAAVPARKESGPQDDGKVSALEKELSAVRSKVEELEKGTGKIDDEALGMMIKPIIAPSMGEISELKEKMAGIERGLLKATKLAMTLKPIQLPEAAPDARRGGAKDLELKVRSLEKAVGSGIGEDRFRAVEKKMEEMREWLPEYIDNKVEKKLSEVDRKMVGKVREMEGLKKEMIESTIEQIIAQPSAAGKMVGEKLRKQIQDIQERVKKMDAAARPSDARLTSIITDVADSQKEISRLRQEMKGVKSVSQEELQDMGIEIKALAAKVDSMHTSVRGVESTGVAGVMRDLEILKTKSEWLESTVHKLDLDRIFQRLEELEGMVRSSSRFSGQDAGPIILE